MGFAPAGAGCAASHVAGGHELLTAPAGDHDTPVTLDGYRACASEFFVDDGALGAE